MGKAVRKMISTMLWGYWLGYLLGYAWNIYCIKCGYMNGIPTVSSGQKMENRWMKYGNTWVLWGFHQQCTGILMKLHLTSRRQEENGPDVCGFNVCHAPWSKVRDIYRSCFWGGWVITCCTTYWANEFAHCNGFWILVGWQYQQYHVLTIVRMVL